MNLLVPARVKAPSDPRIRGKLREAIECMITEGLDRVEAAKKVALSPRAMRAALGKPHVIRYVQERRVNFRAELCGRNEYRLGELRDQNENKMAAVSAIKVLEQLDREESVKPTHNRNVTPGVVVVIREREFGLPPGYPQELIEINPSPDHEETR